MGKGRVNKQRSIYDTTQRQEMEAIFDNMQGQIDRQKDAITRLLAGMFGSRAALEEIADPDSGLDLDGVRAKAREAADVMDAARAAASPPDKQE